MSNTETSPAHELADLVLGGGDKVVNFIYELGCDYEHGKVSEQWRWITEVLNFGIVAGASLQLLQWLILRDFENRGVSHDLTQTNTFIEKKYAQSKASFDRSGFIQGVYRKH
jgi:hypothetical protein